MTPQFHGTIDRQGKLHLDAPIEMRKHLLNMVRGKDEIRAEVVVRKPKKRRSDREHRYYFGVIVKELSNFSGHSPDEMHEALKAMFLSYEENGITFVKSTTDLTTVEAEEYYETIRRWAAETLQVYVPTPSEVDYE